MINLSKPAITPAWFGLILLLAGLLLAGCDAQTSPLPPDPSLIACIPPDQTGVEAQVVRIADGDTITVRIDGQDYRLRYIGINAPELDAQAQKAQAEQAAELNRRLVEDELVILYRDTSETDKYERLLRYVTVDGAFVNYELVRAGLARANDYPPDTACSATLEAAEDQAREENLGIWAGQ